MFLLVLTAFFITLKELFKAKNQIHGQAMARQKQETVSKELGVIYEEVKERQVVTSSDIDIRKNSAYGQISMVCLNS